MIEKIEKVLNVWAVVILVGAFALITWMAVKAFILSPPAPPYGFRDFTEEEKATVKKLIHKHGLEDGRTIIEMRPDGTYWFERGGQLCQMK